jgi:Tfp pilus assembly protein PilV
MFADRFADQRGISLVEVMMSAFALAVGVLATMNVVIGSRDLTTTSEKLEAATHVAEKQLEDMQSLTWTAQAHPAVPASGPAPHTVSAGAYQWQTGSWEPAVVAASTGAVPVASTTWSDGRLRGTVWRFVSWYDDPCCTGTQDLKRLTVVVTVEGRPGPTTPVVLSTLSARKEGV